MQNTQSNYSTNGTQENQDWIHVTINRSCSAPPPVVKQEIRPHTPEDTGYYLAHNASPTTTEYSGTPRKEIQHASMKWTGCHDAGFPIYRSEKEGSGWYPQSIRRSRQPSIAQVHDKEWSQQLQESPVENWTPQQPQQCKARRAHKDFIGWEHCFNNNCKDDHWEKVDAG